MPRGIARPWSERMTAAARTRGADARRASARASSCYFASGGAGWIFAIGASTIA